MAMEVSICVPEPEPEREFPNLRLRNTSTRAVTIGTRTVDVLLTHSVDVVTKWIRHIRRTYRKHMAELVVGVFTDCEEDCWNWKGIYRPDYVSILTLCVGSHCLIYQACLKKANKFSWPETNPIAKELREFCADPGVRFVGKGLYRIAKIIADDCGLKFAQAKELLPLAKKLLNRSTMKEMDLDAVTKALWGGYVDVAKPAEKLFRYDTLADDQILYVVFEAFLASEVGQKVLV